MSLSQALNQFAQNLGRYLGIVVNRQLNVHGGSTSALFNIEICSAKKPKNQKGFYTE